MVPAWTETCRSKCYDFYIVLTFLWFYNSVHQLGKKVFLCYWCTVQTLRCYHPWLKSSPHSTQFTVPRASLKRPHSSTVVQKPMTDMLWTSLKPVISRSHRRNGRRSVTTVTSVLVRTLPRSMTVNCVFSVKTVLLVPLLNHQVLLHCFIWLSRGGLDLNDVSRVERRCCCTQTVVYTQFCFDCHKFCKCNLRLLMIFDPSRSVCLPSTLLCWHVDESRKRESFRIGPCGNRTKRSSKNSRWRC
jgi:hypothetical protein